jgi:Sec-independent protein translocase protein TatA
MQNAKAVESGFNLLMCTVITAIVLLLMAAEAWPATERTTDILFQTFQKAEARFDNYRNESEQLKKQVGAAKNDQQRAEKQLKKALASEDIVGAEKTRVELTEAIAAQIVAEERRVVAALDAFEEIRRDFVRILPRLELDAARQGGGAEAAAASNKLVQHMAEVGQDMRGYVRFLSGLTANSKDPNVRVKLASAMASVAAVEQAVRLARKASANGGSGFHQARNIVANVVDSLSGAIPLLALRQQVLLSQRQRLAMANTLALSRIAAQPLFGSAGLNLVKITETMRDDFKDDIEREGSIEKLYEAEGIGNESPSQGEIEVLLNEMQF